MDAAIDCEVWRLLTPTSRGGGLLAAGVSATSIRTLPPAGAGVVVHPCYVYMNTHIDIHRHKRQEKKRKEKSPDVRLRRLLSWPRRSLPERETPSFLFRPHGTIFLAQPTANASQPRWAASTSAHSAHRFAPPCRLRLATAPSAAVLLRPPPSS